MAVSDDDIARAHSDMDAIVYIAGYAAHVGLKKLHVPFASAHWLLKTARVKWKTLL